MEYIGSVRILPHFPRYLLFPAHAYTLWIIRMKPSANFNYHFCIFGSVIFIYRTKCFVLQLYLQEIASHILGTPGKLLGHSLLKRLQRTLSKYTNLAMSILCDSYRIVCGERTNNLFHRIFPTSNLSIACDISKGAPKDKKQVTPAA